LRATYRYRDPEEEVNEKPGKESERKMEGSGQVNNGMTEGGTDAKEKGTAEGAPRSGQGLERKSPPKTNTLKARGRCGGLLEGNQKEGEGGANISPTYIGQKIKITKG